MSWAELSEDQKQFYRDLDERYKPKPAAGLVGHPEPTPETNALKDAISEYADICAKYAHVEVLRGDVAWKLRQIIEEWS